MSVNLEDLANLSSTPLGILEVALNSVADALVWADSQHQILGCNAAFADLVSHPRDQVLQHNLLDLLPLYGQCDPVPPAAHPATRALQGKASPIEYVFKAAGQSHILNISGSPVATEAGPVAVLVLQDVTAAKATAEAGATNQALLQATLESTADGVFVVARDGRVLGYNQKFIRMWDMPERLLLAEHGRERFQYLAAQTVDPEGFKARVLELFDDAPDAAVFDQLVMKDGRIFERYSQPQYLEGRIVGRIWSYRDITEQQRAEAALRQSEEKFRGIVEQANDVIYLLDRKGMFAYVSPNLKAVAGFELSDLEGLPFSSFVYPEDLSICTAAFQAVLHTGEKQFNIEFRSYHKDGHLIWQSTNLAPSQDATGQPMVLGVTRDISDRKRREEALRLIAEGTAAHTGSAFFRACTQSAVTALQVSGAWITELIEPDQTRARSLAMWVDGQLVENIEFDLPGTPCERVLRGETCYFPEHVADCFPEDRALTDYGVESYLGVPLLSSTGQVIGHLAVVDRQPMVPDANRELILRIFAARAGAELERQRAEEALQQREEKYRAIFENSQVGIGRTQIETGLILEANQRFADIMGYDSPAELIGRAYTGEFYVNPKDREAVLAVLKSQGGIYDFEVQLRRRDASILWGLLSLRLNLAEDCLEFVITDISDRKRVEEDRAWAEAALRQREAEYRLLVETANSVILKWDTQGTVLYLNDYGQKFFGYEAEEIIGHNIVGTLVPTTETTGRDLTDLMANLCRYPDRYMFNENENLCKDGRRVWIAWANKPIQNEQGEVVGILSIGADVTERRRLEENLRQSQQFLNMIVENVPITIFTKNIKEGFRYELINQNSERILGFSREEGIGKTDYDLLPVEMADRYRQQDLAVIAGGTVQETSAEVVQPRTGEQIYLRSVKLPIFDSQGNPSYLLGISEDFTSRKQQEDALRLIVEGTASTTGEEFFQTCVSYLAQVLRVRYAFIAQFESCDRARTLAYWADGAVADNFDYEVAVTPCAEIAPGRLISHPHQIKALFPHSPRLQSMEAESYLGTALLDADGQMLGHLVVLDDKPMGDDPGREFILRIFAARAGAELKRMQAETELRESEERFRTLIANLPGVVYRCHDDEAWTMTFLSEAFEEITGYPASDFINNPIRSINDISLIDPATTQRTVQAALAERQPYVLEYPITHADGGVRWLYEKGQGIFSDDGRLLWLDGVMFDISDRKQAETLIDCQNQVLEEIAAGAPLHQTLSLLVEAFETLARCKAGSILFLDDSGKRLHHSVAPNLPDGYKQAVDGLEIGPAVGSCGTAAYRKEPVIASDILSDPLWESGRELAQAYGLRSCWSMPILASNGQLLGTFALYYDRPHSPGNEDWQLLETAAHLAGIAIERKRTEEELYRAKDAAEAANRAKSQFLANMSHELRTPMNAILGFTQLMARDATLSERQRDSLGVINQSGEHLLSLINDVLEMSKIEAGRVVLNPAPFDLYGLLQTLREMLQARAEAKHLSLEFEIAADVPQYVVGDEGKLRQVLINLLGNAVKFTELGSIVLRLYRPAVPPELAALQDGQTLCFEVADTGPGIAPDILPILFQPFVQANHHVPGEGGTGLGLAITRQFVQLMGGTIDVETDLGYGTTFRFDIDVTLADPASIQPATTGKTVQHLAPGQPAYRVLIVDDRVENREPLRQLLQSVGFETRTAVNGVEAVAQWQAWQPHLIWMDMRMPEMDGYEATRQIRALEQQSDRSGSCKILAITASAFDDQRNVVFAAGCDDFVHKPFQVAVIFDKMAEHIGAQYLYSDSAVKLNARSQKSLQPRDLQVMPSDWVASVSQAAIQADADWLSHLVGQIPPAYDDLAELLMDRVNCFDFDALVELTEVSDDG